MKPAFSYGFPMVSPWFSYVHQYYQRVFPSIFQEYPNIHPYKTILNHSKPMKTPCFDEATSDLLPFENPGTACSAFGRSSASILAYCSSRLYVTEPREYQPQNMYGDSSISIYIYIIQLWYNYITISITMTNITTKYHLVICYIAIENHHFYWEETL